MAKNPLNYGACEGRIEHKYTTENARAIILTISVPRSVPRANSRFSYPKFTVLSEDLRKKANSLEKGMFVRVGFELSTSKRETRQPLDSPGAPKNAFVATTQYYQDCIVTDIEVVDRESK